MTYKARLVVLLYRLGLLPKSWHRMAEVRKLNAEFWLWRRLVNNPKGYYQVEPMPSEQELEKYYSEIYWTTVRAKAGDCVLRYRDLNHWREIVDIFDGKAPGSLFNFGAGHGGVSILAAAGGTRVVNYDPGNQVEFPGIENVEDPASIESRFDLVYSSHSLEHVRDPEKTMETLMSLMKPGGKIFVEVPNCHPTRGTFPRVGVEPPHTLYFRRKFFKNLPLSHVVIKTLDGVKSKNGPTFNDNDNGSVIRYIGERTDKELE